MDTNGDKPQEAALLLRLSTFAEGDEGITNQEKRLRRKARDIGWTVGPDKTHVIIEPGVSAYKRKVITIPGRSRPELRTVRPGLRLALDMLYDGRADGLIADDLDRIARDPRDLEDLIDVAESRSAPVTSVSGSIDLSSDAGIMAARVNVAVANKSSRDTARRVKQGHQSSAGRGRPRAGGRYRPFGYERALNGEEKTLTIVDSEAAEIGAIADAILAGTSLNKIARDMNARGVKTQSGKAEWRPTTIRQIVRNPRIAGITACRNKDGRVEEIGKGNWPAILTEDKWRAVNEVLSDPRRKRQTSAVPWSRVKAGRGRPPSRVGSGIYKCGVPDCGHTLVVNGYAEYPRYVCPEGGLARRADDIDRLVVRVVTAWLARPEARKLVRKRATDDTEGELLRQESARLSIRLDEVISLYDDGTITKDELRERRTAFAKRIAEIEEVLEVTHNIDPLDGIAGEPDAAEIWERLSPERQRAILRELVIVTILPVGPGNHYFDPSKVRIEFPERRRTPDRRRKAGARKPERRRTADRRT